MNISHAWILVGPTAVGKTAVAQHLAACSGADILSADAMLVYRGMDIGTAKPTPAERGNVRYLGIDFVAPDQPFSVGAWLECVRAQCAAVAPGHAAADAATAPTGEAARVPAANDLMVVGGTGLYLRALTTGLDTTAADPEQRRHWQERLAHEGLDALRRELARRAPDAAAGLADPDNPRRVIRALEHLDAYGALPAGWHDAPRPRAVGLLLPRSALHARIAARVEQMFASGLLDEVAALRKRFPSWAAPSTPGDSPTTFTARMAIGYTEVCDLLDGKLTPAQAKAQIVVRTRQLAKRQETWFRHQADVAWVEIAPDEPVASVAVRVLATWRQHGPTPIQLS